MGALERIVNTVGICHNWGPKHDSKMTFLWGYPLFFINFEKLALPSSFLAVKRGPTPSGTPETPKPLKTIQNTQTRTTFKTLRREPLDPSKSNLIETPKRPIFDPQKQKQKRT